MPKPITFRQILFLHMMSLLQEPPNQGMLPSQFFESAYNWLEEEGVTPNYTRRFRKNNKFYQQTCELMYSLGLIEPVEKRNRGYVLTSEGEALLREFGSDWRKWPLLIDIHPDGSPDYQNAIYAYELENAHD